MATYVIDLNFMENPAFVEFPVLTNLILNEPDARLVVPDVAFVEMSKHENWECTMRLAFAQFKLAVQRTFISMSVGEAISTELNILHAIDSSALIPDDFKVFIQKLIPELIENHQGESMMKISSQFTDVRAALLLNELNAIAAKEKIAKLVESFVKGIKPDVMKAMRNGTYDEKFVLCFTKVNAEVFCEKYLKMAGIPDEEVANFIAEKPMILRYFYLIVRHSLEWAKSNNVDQVRSDRELNNQLDQEYALIASFFDGLLTKDKKALKAYEDLKFILDIKASEAVNYLNDVLGTKAEV